MKLLLAKIYSEEGMLNVDTLESMSLKLSKSGEFIESLILPSFIALSNQCMMPSTFLFGGLNLISTSFGLFEIKLPSMSSLPFTNHVTSSEEVCVTIRDTDTLNKVINAFSFCNEPSTKQIKDKAPYRIFGNIPYTFEFPKIRIKVESTSIEVDNTLSTETSVRCGHTLILNNADKKQVKLQGLHLSESLDEGIFVEVEQLNELLVPGLIQLNDPCIDIKIQFHNDELIANVAGLRLSSLLGQDSEIHSTKGSDSPPILSLPYQVKCNFTNFQLLNFQSSCSVVVKTLAMSISQTGNFISLNVEEGATVLGIPSDKNMILGSFGAIHLKLPTNMSCFDLVECHCVSAALETVGDMYGGFRAAVSTTAFVNSKLQIPGTINFCFEKLDSEVTSNLQQFLTEMSSIFPSQSSFIEFPFPTYINSFLVSASEPELNLKLETISSQKTSLVVNSVTGTIINKASCSLSTVSCYVNSLETNIGSVISLFLADNVTLQQPVNNVRIIFNNELAVYIEDAIQLLLLKSQSTKSPIKQDSKEEESTLAFPIMLSLSKIILTPQGQETSSTLQDTLLNVCPRQADLLSDGTNEVSIQLQLSEMSNKLFQIHALKTSFDTSLNNPDIIKLLKVAISKANVTAGFSTVDWVSLIKPKDNVSNEGKHVTVYRTSHCNIDSIVLNLSYKGKVVSSKANVKLSPYQGDHNCTSDIIISHYIKQIQSRVPGFITNIKVLGADVLDASMTSVATVAAHTNLGVGSVAGVALADAIRAGIDTGKKARNADTNEGYKFGDLTRGSIRGIREAAKDGANMRGGDPDTYVPGDFIAGTAKAVGSYTSNNKKKLTTAGGAGVASMVGLAVAGPLGFVAGSYLGGKATKAVVGEDAPRQTNSGDNCSTNINGVVTCQDVKNDNSTNQPIPPPHSAFQHHQQFSMQQHQHHHHHQQQQQQQLNYQNIQRNSTLPSEGLNYNQQSTRSTSATPSYSNTQQYKQELHSNLQYQQQRHQNNKATNNQDSNFDQFGSALPPSHQQLRQYQQNHQQQPQQQQYNNHNAYNNTFSTNPGPHYNQQGVHSNSMPQSHSNRQNYQHQQKETEGYQFGDFTKSIINKGKKARGKDEKSGYKFGDFTRGLFK